MTTTVKTVTTVKQAELDELAELICREHDLCRESFGKGLQHAIECGRLLTDAKAQCAHGEWLPWLESNTEISPQMAQRYMRLFNRQDELTANASRVTHLPMREALALLAEPGEDNDELKAHQLINSSQSNEWYTPTRYIEAVRQVLGAIDLDPASCEIANKIIRATRIHTVDDDGFSQSWQGRVFLNPPYGRDEEDSNQARWSARLVDEYQAGNVKAAILLVNAVTGEKWFSRLWDFPVCFTDHRIKFYNMDGEYNQPTHSNAFVYMGDDAGLFARVFCEIGVVVKRFES